MAYFIRLTHSSSETLERKRIKHDLILLCRLVYGFCNLNVPDFILISPSNFKTRGSGLKIGTEHSSSDFRRHSYISRVAVIPVSVELE